MVIIIIPYHFHILLPFSKKYLQNKKRKTPKRTGKTMACICQAPVTFPFNSSNTARVNPQAGQGIPVVSRSQQVPPNNQSAVPRRSAQSAVAVKKVFPSFINSFFDGVLSFISNSAFASVLSGSYFAKFILRYLS